MASNDKDKNDTVGLFLRALGKFICYNSRIIMELIIQKLLKNFKICSRTELFDLFNAEINKILNI